MTKGKRTVNWNIPVPRDLDQRVEKAVSMNSHITKSELVRDAVRRLLEARKETIGTS
jgi:Arc/MetJ-type ribon-helix-helix transcriptional regulator